jgi:hypothetical protein
MLAIFSFEAHNIPGKLWGRGIEPLPISITRNYAKSWLPT